MGSVPRLLVVHHTPSPAMQAMLEAAVAGARDPELSAVSVVVTPRAGATVGRVFTDPGRSAWNSKVHRPGWEALMARLESGESDGVVVFDLPRFARRPADGERLIAAAERGLSILDDGSEYDLTTASGRKNFRDAVNAAAYYSDMISESSRRGKAFKAQQGEVDNRRSFGFEADGVTLLEAEAAILRDHARRLLAGETQDSLIAELNRDYGAGLHGARWGYTTYRQIMTRPRNVGLIVHNGEPVSRLPGAPILDQLTHDRIVALYASRKPGGQRSGKYVLTGVAHCGECGAALSGRPGSSGKPQYWCRPCHGVFVDASRLDEWAEDFAIRALRDEEGQEALARASAELEKAREALIAESASIETTLTELAGRLGRQEISLARHDAACKPLEARQAAIRAEIAELALQEPEPLSAGRTIPQADASHVDLLDRWENGTAADKRAMVIRALNGRRLIVGRALVDGKLAVGPAPRSTGRRFDPARVRIE
jgi:DNA invertase Pin-like site-specific DNA recombinase